MKFLLATLFVALSWAPALAAESTIEHSIESERLGQIRTVAVHVPSSYDTQTPRNVDDRR